MQQAAALRKTRNQFEINRRLTIFPPALHRNILPRSGNGLEQIFVRRYLRANNRANNAS
jgi:hypothetical protein